MSDDKKYEFIDFKQFSSNNEKDRLILFAAKSSDLLEWAGIPRKGWKIRMLYQRWITDRRNYELKNFWQKASNPDPLTGQYILSPTAITIAIKEDALINDGKIDLAFESPIANIKEDFKQIEVLASKVLDDVKSRLTAEQKLFIDREFSVSPYSVDFPQNFENDYVFEFCLQLVQMINSGSEFIKYYQIGKSEIDELIVSLDSISRPAVVVDGQHRLVGSANIENVLLPVVAIPKADWIQQIFQFIVINEKSKAVDPTILNDIFSCSLSPSEKISVSSKFDILGVNIEERILGTTVGFNTKSPFDKMLKLNLPNAPDLYKNAYLSQRVISNLILGGAGSLSWKDDADFYDSYVSHTFADREHWSSWNNGKWLDYWFAFWTEVKETFNEMSLSDNQTLLWDTQTQTNLTLGVSLKMLQRFFMERQITLYEDYRNSVESTLGTIKGALQGRVDDSTIEKIVDDEHKKLLSVVAIPSDINAFRMYVREFLQCIPLRFFTKTWKTSLDQQEGQRTILDELRRSFGPKKHWKGSTDLFDTN